MMNNDNRFDEALQKAAQNSKDQRLGTEIKTLQAKLGELSR